MKKHLPELQRIANYLCDQIESSRKKYSPDSPYYSLIWGAAEADTSADRKFYYSGNVWSWRGLHDLFGEMFARHAHSGDE